MKKTLFLLMLSVALALTSCGKSEDVTQPSGGSTLNATFNVCPPTTRAEVSGLTRYIVEAYEGANLTAPPQRVESASGLLTLTLKKNTNYTFLFWADKGTVADGTTLSGGNYDASDLKAVKPAAATVSNAGEQAYCLSVTFNSDDFAANASQVLKNAVASINLVQSGTGIVTTGNTVKITYANLGTFNVADGTITANSTATPVTRTFTVSATTGTIAKDYVLSGTTKELVNLTVQFNDEPAKTITNVPVQTNYRTNITGEFSNIYASSFTVSSEVEDYTNQDK